MDINTKPQALNLGQVAIDDKSNQTNVIPINALSTKSGYIVGKSSPMITDDTIINATSRDEVKEQRKRRDEIREAAGLNDEMLWLKELKEQRKRREDAAMRMQPMRCGCRDPLYCRCYEKRGV